jgi:hypothetical protein
MKLLRKDMNPSSRGTVPADPGDVLITSHWLEKLEELRRTASEGDQNDPQRELAIRDLKFLLAELQMQTAIKEAIVADRQLEISKSQSRVALWSMISTVALVIATILLVVATLHLHK